MRFPRSGEDRLLLRRWMAFQERPVRTVGNGPRRRISRQFPTNSLTFMLKRCSGGFDDQVEEDSHSMAFIMLEIRVDRFRLQNISISAYPAFLDSSP